MAILTAPVSADVDCNQLKTSTNWCAPSSSKAMKKQRRNRAGCMRARMQPALFRRCFFIALLLLGAHQLVLVLS